MIVAQIMHTFPVVRHHPNKESSLGNFFLSRYFYQCLPILHRLRKQRIPLRWVSRKFYSMVQLSLEYHKHENA